MKTHNTKGREAKIFGRREVNPQTETFSAGAAIATWSAISPAGSALLTQDVVISCSQEITRLYEIGSQRIYIVAGRPQGNWKAARVTGPRSVSIQFYLAYAPSPQDPPALQCRTFGGQPEAGANPSGFVMTAFEIAGVGLQVTSGPMAIQDQVIGVFEQLDVIATR